MYKGFILCQVFHFFKLTKSFIVLQLTKIPLFCSFFYATAHVQGLKNGSVIYFYFVNIVMNRLFIYFVEYITFVNADLVIPRPVGIVLVFFFFIMQKDNILSGIIP